MAEGLAARARALEDGLYHEVSTLPPEAVEATGRELTNVLVDKYSATEADVAAWMPHRYRFLLTVKALDDLLADAGPETTVLEMGSESPFSDLLRARYPSPRWVNTEGDLRRRWDIGDETVDLLVSTEVLEHLQDIPNGVQDHFARSGLTAALSESRRVLRGGGHLFCTTPNGTSIYILRNLLLGTEGWFSSPHVREYTVAELKQRLSDVGLRVLYARTVHCMTVDYHIDCMSTYDCLLRLGLPTEDRGDDIFLLAEKD